MTSRPVNDPEIPLELSALCAEATKMTGLADFDGDDFREGLGILLESLRSEARLNGAGVELFHDIILQGLVNRLEIRAAIDRHPDITTVALKAPLVIIGFPRTGTTLLQRLFWHDPHARVPLFWEMWSPAPPVEPGTPPPDARLRGATEFARRLSPLRAVHEVDALQPEECLWLFRNSFVSPIFTQYARVASYARWLGKQDPNPLYDYYKKQLQILAYHHPSEHLVLKQPTHLWYLQALLRVCPNANIVFTVREPLDVLGSLCSLTAANVALWSDASIDLRAMGEGFAGLLSDVANSFLAQLDELDQRRVTTIRYADLVEDPVAAVKGINERFGYPIDERFVERASRWHRENPRHKHGAHRYELSTFLGDVSPYRAAFDAYRKRFGLDAVD